MKKVTKLLINFIAVVMLVVATIGMSACEDIKKLDVKINLYNYDISEFYSEEKVNFNIDLYRHLAPKTVDAVISHVSNGYYDDALFYTAEDTGYDLIFFGDLKMNSDGKIVQNLIDGKLPSQIYGEFAKNGTKGSDIPCALGSVGLYRSYYANDSGFTTSSTARDSGRATIFAPQGSYSTYNGNFCFFGKFDMENSNTKTAVNSLTDIFKNIERYDFYVIYYTGTYDVSKPDENHGLTFHCVTEKEYNDLVDEGIDGLFTASGEQLASYNKCKIKVPQFITKSGTKKLAASIKSVTVK